MKDKTLFFSVIVFIIFFAFVGLFILIKNPFQKPIFVQPISPTPIVITPSSSLSIEIHGFPATVKSVEEGYLIVQAGENEFKVYVSEMTIIQKISVKKLSEGEKPKPERISFSEIKPGDFVSIAAKENIFGKKEFEASIITLIEK